EHGAQRRSRHRHRDGAVQVVAVPHEGRVLGDADLDVEVTGRAASGSDLALPGQLHAGAVVDAGRDLDVEGAPRADATVAATLAARVGDRRTVAAAGRAGAQRTDLSEERTLDLRDLTCTTARLAGHRLGAGRGAGPVAAGAGHRRVDLDLTGHP